jgi:hypothetical protein
VYKTEISFLGTAPDAVKIEAALAGKELLHAAARGASNLLKEHFLGLNADRHGGYSTAGFYEQAADQVFDDREHGEAIGVGTTKVGIALRRWGAHPLRPRDKAYLAIPNYDFLSITHGRSPLEFTNLRVLFGHQETGQIGPIGLVARPGGAAFEKDGRRPRIGTGEISVREKTRVVRGEDGQAKREGTGEFEAKEKTKTTEGEVLFWLKKFVFMSADESVLPTDQAIADAGERAAYLYLGMTPPGISAIANN